MKYVIAFMVFIALLSSAKAQTLSECRLIDNDADRLMCYDRIPSGMSLSSASTNDSTIASFAGLGMHSTRMFVASGPWEIKWSSKNKPISISLHDDNKKILVSYGVGERSYDGRAYWPNGGTFFFEVITSGSWQIEVKNAP